MSISPGTRKKRAALSSALAAAGVRERTGLDGVDLVPHLTDRDVKPVDRDLYWRFWNQSAIRSGDWKYIVTGSGRQLLFNLRRDKEEKHSLLAEHQERAVAMRAKLIRWTNQLRPIGLPVDEPNGQERRWYEHYFQATGQVPIK